MAPCSRRANQRQASRPQQRSGRADQRLGVEIDPPKKIVNPGSRSDTTEDISLKELDRAFTDLAEQLRTQYVLGFYSTNEKRDGSFRKLSMRVKKAGYQARAR